MAVASDSLYNAGTPYISSHSYYGYVPSYRNESQPNAAIGHAEIADSPAFERCSYDTAMETDDYDCSVTSGCVSNDSLILEESTRNRLRANDKQCRQETAWDADTLRRRNRKRCSGDLGSASELKKFREGSGNYHLHCGTGCTKDYGYAKVSYESDALYINKATDKCPGRSTKTNDNCCWAAGNNKHSLVHNTSCKHVLSSNDYKLNENNIEYEEILFATHGCSIYHFHRSQMFDSECTEAEF